MSAPIERSGGQILVDQLRLQGVDRATCVPGESYLAVLDALRDTDIDLVVCRNEGGAAMMAEAYGKLTGRPGICFVTRGPGATNASHGLHIARQDSTPMILFVGQIETGMREREAFQELDYRAAFGAIAKWVVEIDDPARLPELIARAFRVAMQGRPGPVVVALPEDMLTGRAGVADAPFVEPSRAAPDPAAMERLASMLHAARAPLLILGGSAWTPAGLADIARFAERNDLPVATSFRRSDLFSALHPNYAGEFGLFVDARLKQRLAASDLVLLLGGRFSESPSQAYTLLDIPAPRQRLVHVYPDPDEIGRVYQPELGIIADPSLFAHALAALPPVTGPAWAGSAAAAHADYLEFTETPRQLPGDFQYGEVVAWLRGRLPPSAILTNGAGNYTGWLHRHYRFRQPHTLLAPTSGSMGYGVPAAVMAKRQHPESIVVAFAGDGCFLMNGQEFATAVQHDIPLIVLVLDNAQYGTIRMHQERHYPGRVSGTQLQNPDFAAYARAFGGHGETVRATAEFAPAFERALASGRPAIIHCHLDPRAESHAANRKDPESQP